MDTGVRGLVHIAEHSRRDAGEERGAEGCTFLDCCSLERDAEHRGQDLDPQRAARAPSGHPPGVDGGAEPAEELERVAQPVRDALEDRSHQGPAVVPQRKPDERAARIWIRVRRPLAGEVGREEQPLRSGRPRLGLGVEPVVVGVRGEV